MFSHSLHTGYKVRPKVWLSAIVTAVLVAAYLFAASALWQVSAPETAVAAPLRQAAAAQSTATITTSGASTTVATPSAPNCTPSPATSLSTIDLSAAGSGLTNRTDPTAQYRIYGNTASQLREQIRQCAPGNDGNGGAEYTAVTSYTLSWQYDTIVNGDTCRVTNAKVGVHIRTTLPLWEPTAAASNGLAAKWQNFMTALSTHEAGHAMLDAQYARKLTDDLNNLPAMSCDNLTIVTRNTANADVAALNRANDTYDDTTGHGATQGAILPQ